jgi:hypothetical protein
MDASLQRSVRAREVRRDVRRGADIYFFFNQQTHFPGDKSHPLGSLAIVSVSAECKSAEKREKRVE